MSFILEALRKAERERHLGQPPSLQDVARASAKPDDSEGRSLRPWISLTAGTILVLALVLFVALRQPDPTPAPVPAPPLAASMPPQEVSASRTPSSPPAAARLPEPAETSELAEPFVNDDAPPALDESAAIATLDDVLEPKPEPVAAPVPVPPAPVEPVDGTRVSPGFALAPAATPAASQLPAALPPTGVGRLHDMPSDYRAAFASVSVQVHVYDADPAKRWLLINGRRHREGDSLPQGPSIAEIRPDGIVFDYQGRKALMGVVQ